MQKPYEPGKIENVILHNCCEFAHQRYRLRITRRLINQPAGIFMQSRKVLLKIPAGRLDNRLP